MTDKGPPSAVFIGNKSYSTTLSKLCIKGLNVLEDNGELYSGPRKIEDTILAFTELKHLEIRETWIPEITDVIGELENLESIKVVLNPNLTVISERMSDLKKLCHLHVETTPLSYLPLPTSTYLVDLSLINCGLEHLPAGIGKLARLQRLSAPRNKLREVPRSLCHAHKLVSLNLEENMIDSFPGTVAQGLTKLKTLSLKKNRIREVEPHFVHSLAPTLECLILDNNQIQEIPDCMSEMVRLTHLSFKNNMITNVPAVVLYSLVLLNDIFMDGNPLTDPVFGHVSKKGQGTLDLNPQGDSLLQEIQRGYLNAFLEESKSHSA